MSTAPDSMRSPLVSVVVMADRDEPQLRRRRRRAGRVDGRVSPRQRRAARHRARGQQRDRRPHAHRARRRVHHQHRRRLRRQLLRHHARRCCASCASRRSRPTRSSASSRRRSASSSSISARRAASCASRSSRPAGKLRAAAMFARASLRRGVHIAKVKRLARLDRGETVEHWGLRTVGETAYHYLLRTGIEPFFYVGCEDISAAFGKALVRHALKWQLLVLPAGMGALCDALAQRVEVRTGCQASGIEVRDASVAVHHAGGTVEADYAVIAAPATAVAKLEGAVDRSGPRRRRQRALRAEHHALLRLRAPDHGAVSAGDAGRTRAAIAIARVRTWSALAPQYVPEGKELLAIHATRLAQRRAARARPGQGGRPSCAPTPRRCSAASPIPTGSASTRAPRAPSSRRPATIGAWPPSCAARARASSTPATGSPARPSRARCAPRSRPSGPQGASRCGCSRGGMKR